LVAHGVNTPYAKCPVYFSEFEIYLAVISFRISCFEFRIYFAQRLFALALDRLGAIKFIEMIGH